MFPTSFRHATMAAFAYTKLNFLQCRTGHAFAANFRGSVKTKFTCVSKYIPLGFTLHKHTVNIVTIAI